MVCNILSLKVKVDFFKDKDKDLTQDNQMCSNEGGLCQCTFKRPDVEKSWLASIARRAS